MKGNWLLGSPSNLLPMLGSHDQRWVIALIHRTNVWSLLPNILNLIPRTNVWFFLPNILCASSVPDVLNFEIGTGSCDHSQWQVWQKIWQNMTSRKKPSRLSPYAMHNTCDRVVLLLRGWLIRAIMLTRPEAWNCVERACPQIIVRRGIFV